MNTKNDDDDVYFLARKYLKVSIRSMIFTINMTKTESKNLRNRLAPVEPRVMNTKSNNDDVSFLAQKYFNV